MGKHVERFIQLGANLEWIKVKNTETKVKKGGGGRKIVTPGKTKYAVKISRDILYHLWLTLSSHNHIKKPNLIQQKITI